MSVKSDTPRGTATRRRYALSVVAGLAGAAVGAVGGLIVGANIGGNWFTSVSIGSLHGYEATSMVGALLGAVLLGVLSVWLTWRSAE